MAVTLPHAGPCVFRNSRSDPSRASPHSPPFNYHGPSSPLITASPLKGGSGVPDFSWKMKKIHLLYSVPTVYTRTLQLHPCTRHHAPNNTGTPLQSHLALLQSTPIPDGRHPHLSSFHSRKVTLHPYITDARDRTIAARRARISDERESLTRRGQVREVPVGTRVGWGQVMAGWG